MNDNVSISNSSTPLFFLIGFMGCGKSLLSQGVSQIADVITIEMDEEIEKSAGMSINAIFKTVGEEKFRKLERKILHELIAKYGFSEKIVLISTGGGAPCYFDNMEVMNKTGTTIFINPSIDRLSARLEYKKHDRPLIKDRTSIEIREFVKSTLEKRLTYYNKAQIEVNMTYDDKAQNIEFLKDIIMKDSSSEVPFN